MKTTSPGMHDHEDTFFAHHVFDPLETKVNPGSINSFFSLSSTLPFRKKGKEIVFRGGSRFTLFRQKSCISLHYRGDSDDPDSFCFPYRIT